MNLKYLTSATLAAAFFLAGCQSTEPEENAAPEPANTTPAAEQPAPERRNTAEQRATRSESGQTATANVDPAREIPRLEGDLESEGYGMTMIIDGSSPQAFAESLEMVASDTSPEQYRQLDSAIRYLETYSLGTRNLGEFYNTIDGMTPEEIIAMAQNLNRR